jgi:hypothetical protein
MLKSDKTSIPYFNLANNNFSSISATNFSKSNASSFNLKENSLFSNNQHSSSNSSFLNNPTQQKVTRRVAHEICEKRKLEEQEFELSKRVKTEGDVNENLIKELVNQVETEFANVENDVNNFDI